MRAISPFSSSTPDTGLRRRGAEEMPDNQRTSDRLRRLENMRASEIPIDTITGLNASDIQAALEAIMSSDGIAQAIREVKSTYGDTVSVITKAKSLSKFGRNRAVGASWETVAELQGTTANETFVSTNIIDSIVSDNAGDTMTVVIEGHTIDGSGNLTFSSQDATLNGQTEVTLGTPLARATRIYVKASGTFNSPQSAPAGNVYVYDNTDGITAGVPNTAAATKVMLVAGATQSEKASTAISSVDYWFIQSFATAIGDPTGPTNLATIRMETRDVKNGGVWRPLGKDYTLWPDTVGIDREFDPPLIVPKNHDWRIVAQTDAGTSEIYGEARGVLAGVVT